MPCLPFFPLFILIPLVIVSLILTTHVLPCPFQTLWNFHCNIKSGHTYAIRENISIPVNIWKITSNLNWWYFYSCICRWEVNLFVTVSIHKNITWSRLELNSQTENRKEIYSEKQRGYSYSPLNEYSNSTNIKKATLSLCSVLFCHDYLTNFSYPHRIVLNHRNNSPGFYY